MYIECTEGHDDAVPGHDEYIGEIGNFFTPVDLVEYDKTENKVTLT